MPEPAYIIERGDDSVTVWIDKPGILVKESVVPLDGSVMIRDMVTGRIVGKRLDRLSKWTEDSAADSLATAFGWGGAGPILALRAAGVHFQHTK